MNRRKYRKTWLKHQKAYERYAYSKLMPLFKGYNDAIEWDKMNIGNYPIVIEEVVSKEKMYATYFDIYSRVGLLHGKRVGKFINEELKNFTDSAFLKLWEEQLQYFFRNQGFRRVNNINTTYVQTIIRLMETRLSSGMSLEEAVSEVQKQVRGRGFYRWQTLRIARTESTSAANFGALQSSHVSGFVMEKEWISANDARTRGKKPTTGYDHYHMNGIKVPQDGKFTLTSSEFGTDLLEFPGDPEGKPGNLINCRCTIALVPKRDDDGNFIRKL